MAEADDDAPGVPEWVVTYGDMMSLLLTFFIMLVSMSELKQDGRVRAMLDALKEQFGSGMGTQGVPGPSLQRTGAFKSISSDGNTAEGGMRRSGRKSGGPAGPHATVERVAHGSVLTLGGPATFPPRATGLVPELERDLDVLVDVLRDRPNKVVVRGHASPDDAPPLDAPADAPDLLDVSLARARNVAAYLAAHGIHRRRILVEAAGATEPFVVTRDDGERRHNRRVDVFVVDSYTTPPAPTDGTAETTNAPAEPTAGGDAPGDDEPGAAP